MINTPENPFSKLSLIINRFQKNIEYIVSGGISRSRNYQILIAGFRKKIEDGVDLVETNVSLNELIYVANEMATNKDFLKEILEYEDEFEIILLLFQREIKLSINKNLLKLYFNHFSLMSTFPKTIKTLEKYIKDFLSGYEGKNRLINVYKAELTSIFSPFDLLIKENYDVDKIQKQFSLLADSEYILVMLNYKLVQKIEQLTFDEKDEKLFSELVNKKDLIFKDNYNLKEYVVKNLLTRAMTEKQPFPNWQQFLLDIIGDPRSSSIYSSNRTSWSRIGENLKIFFTSSLSKEDLKLFLEQLSEKGDILNYEYRKAFWLAFTDYVKYAKLIVGRDVFSLLPQETQRKIKRDETCYATYNQNEQSAIYIDFGKIKIIEYTHNGSVRGFSECPIKLSQHSYVQQELISYKYNLFTEAHTSPATYNWQGKVLAHMNKYLGTNLRIEDLYIDEDKRKRSKYQDQNTKSLPKKALVNKSEPKIKCRKCELSKASSEFGKNKNTASGYTLWCTACMNKRK